jgi:adenine deaminase
MKSILLKGGRIIDMLTKKIGESDILIENGLISRVFTSHREEVNKDLEVIDLSGKYVSPGFIDSHIHIESSMLSPLEFSRTAVVHGTTTMLVDPHEIANVFGIRAINLFLKQSELLPLDMYIGIPSCVPATNLENSGSTITLEDIENLIGNERVFGLAEMMNFPGIIHDLGDSRKMVDTVFNLGKLVDGHCPGLTGEDLITYITNGRRDGIIRIMSDHETSSPAEAIDKLKSGIHLAIRYGSADKALNDILPELIRKRVDLSRCMLCSDDISPRELIEAGHVDRIIKRAREVFIEHSGLDLEGATIEAITLATLNPARYIARFLRYHNHPMIGEIAEGYKANLVILDNLEDLKVDRVLYNGESVVENGIYQRERIDYDYSEFIKSVNVGELGEEDFRIAYDGEREFVDARIIEVIPNSLLTKSTASSVTTYNKELHANPERDILKIAVFERHHATGSHAISFVKGLGLKRNATASTVAHDSHNLIVAGIDDKSMARAANHLIRNGGGMVAVDDDQIYYLPLKIGGLMSLDTIEEVVENYRSVQDGAKALGTDLENFFMTLSFLALPVIPELKITDKGLVDVSRFEIVPLYEEG